ncbi:MAG: DUF72 domain-containing protein [Proteobacteria bacterium]|nr:DUF72 domain-containing protein [Pseudomonadota bacterium]
MADLRIGTAGWSIPRAVADAFPGDGTGLQRYASRFEAAEINTTFYRPHKPQTYERWAETTPDGFRFAVKAPKAVTHAARLVDSKPAMAAFLAETSALGDKRGPVLVQLPPSLALDEPVAARFFDEVRSLYAGPMACEPRHASWFTPEADALLSAHRVARVAADPARHPDAGRHGGWSGLRYWRLHGSPDMYRSGYSEEFLAQLAQTLGREPEVERWCVFDNTTLGAAARDALALQAMTASAPISPSD